MRQAAGTTGAHWQLSASAQQQCRHRLDSLQATHVCALSMLHATSQSPMLHHMLHMHRMLTRLVVLGLAASAIQLKCDVTTTNGIRAAAAGGCTPRCCLLGLHRHRDSQQLARRAPTTGLCHGRWGLGAEKRETSGGRGEVVVRQQACTSSCLERTLQTDVRIRQCISLELYASSQSSSQINSACTPG
jgi:hypothetical protein